MKPDVIALRQKIKKLEAIRDNSNIDYHTKGNLSPTLTSKLRDFHYRRSSNAEKAISRLRSLITPKIVKEDSISSQNISDGNIAGLGGEDSSEPSINNKKNRKKFFKRKYK